MWYIIILVSWNQHLLWWRHQMEAFSALLALCAENSPVTSEFTAQRPVTRSFDVFFDLRLNKRLSKQSWGWWFETPLYSLWRHCNVCRYWNEKCRSGCLQLLWCILTLKYIEILLAFAKVSTRQRKRIRNLDSQHKFGEKHFWLWCHDTACWL